MLESHDNPPGKRTMWASLATRAIHYTCSAHPSASRRKLMANFSVNRETRTTRLDAPYGAHRALGKTSIPDRRSTRRNANVELMH